MKFFDNLIGGLEKISLRLVWLSGALLIAAAAMVTVDVILRKLFNWSLGGADEITGYVFGISIMFSLSYAIIHRTHIRIDAAYQYMPAWLRAALDILGAALLTGFVSYVAYRGYFMLADTYENGSRSITPMRTPLAIPQTPWFAGMVFAVFTGLVMITAAIVAFFKGDFPYINKLLGIPSVDEQIEDET